MKRKLVICCVIAIVGAGVMLRAVESLRIVPLVRDDEVLVSFALIDAYTDEVRDVIASGLRTTFTYDLELRMIVPLWVDRTVATSVVMISDQYDTLTRRHSLERTVDGRTVETVVTEDEEVVRLWLTRWDRLPLGRTSTLVANRDYYVRVRAQGRPYGGSLLGWTKVITGEVKFTFVPRGF